MIPDPDLIDPVAGPEPDSWERRDGETEHSYAAFAVYRGLGPLRSLRKAAALFYSNSTNPEDARPAQMSTVKDWSSKNDWPDRAHAWDAYLDAVAREEQVEAVRDMNRVHATIGRNMLGRVQAQLREMVGGETPVKLTAGELARWLDVGVKVERLARGQATQVTREADEVPSDEHEAAKERAKHLVDELEAARARKTGT